MFIVMLNNVKPPLDDLVKYMEPHLKFLDKFYSMKKIGFFGKKNPRPGGVII